MTPYSLLLRPTLDCFTYASNSCSICTWEPTLRATLFMGRSIVLAPGQLSPSLSQLNPFGRFTGRSHPFRLLQAGSSMWDAFRGDITPKKSACLGSQRPAPNLKERTASWYLVENTHPHMYGSKRTTAASAAVGVAAGVALWWG